jgi:hypothetical protein
MDGLTVLVTGLNGPGMLERRILPLTHPLYQQSSQLVRRKDK